MKINKKLKYALVLSGGGARGLVHVGVLCALEKAGFPPPSLVAGASMGAIVGGLYASGMKPDELKKIVEEELELSEFMESPGFKFGGPVGKVFLTGQFIGNFATRPGIDSGNKTLSLLEKFLQGKSFTDCQIPFLCNAVDITSGKEVILDSGPLAPAIRASMSFPAFFEPCVENGRCLVDGGILDNMPVGPAREAGRALGISRILAVDTHSIWKELPASSFKTGFSVIMRCFDVLVREASKNQCEADLTLYAADHSSVFDFNRKRELVALGEAAFAAAAKELEAFFGLRFFAFSAIRRRRSGGIRLEGKYHAAAE